MSLAGLHGGSWNGLRVIMKNFFSLTYIHTQILIPCSSWWAPLCAYIFVCICGDEKVMSNMSDEHGITTPWFLGWYARFGFFRIDLFFSSLDFIRLQRGALNICFLFWIPGPAFRIFDIHHHGVILLFFFNRFFVIVAKFCLPSIFEIRTHLKKNITHHGRRWRR